MTKLFLDTEFTGLHQNTTLISLALVADSGEEFYAELTDFDRDQVTPWIHEHVVQHLKQPHREATFCDTTTLLGSTTTMVGPTYFVAAQLQAWLQQFPSCEIWSDTLAYDWVLFCQLFGGALNIPKNVYYIPFDLATLFKVVGIDPDVNREEFAARTGWTDDLPTHNALHDARVQRECYKVCQELIVVKSHHAMLL